MNFNFKGEKLFFTADTHFNHANIIKFCNRPFKSVEQMNETLITNWNSVISEDDIVFHLGDFCLGGAAEWTKLLDRLNGKIYLILGNHDLKNFRQGFIQRFEHVALQMFITVDKSSYHPTEVKLLQKQKWTTFTISNLKVTKLADDAFRFNSKDFPSAEVIDLR